MKGFIIVGEKRSWTGKLLEGHFEEVEIIAKKDESEISHAKFIVKRKDGTLVTADVRDTYYSLNGAHPKD